MKTLEEYLRETLAEQIIDHTMRASVDEDGIVRFYVHPDGHDGDTLDFRVDGNALVPITNEDN